MDAFSDLALRHLEQPEDAELRAAIEQALVDHPEWTSEWQALRTAHARLTDALPIARELSQPAPAPDEAPPVPWDRLGLDSNPVSATKPAPSPRRPRRLRRPWRMAWIAGAVAGLVIAGLLSRRPTGPDRDALARLAAPSLAMALTGPLDQVLAGAHQRVQRGPSPAGLILRCPLVAAAAGDVPLVWTGPVQLDAVLLQQGKPIWTAAALSSPAALPQLPADAVYELRLTPTGTSASAETTHISRFVTVAVDASTAAGPSDPIANLVRAASAQPARLGEAITTWWALPETLRTSDAGIRLGLWLGTEANQPDLLRTARRLAGAADEP